jgi:hypothetical protein
LPRRHPTFGAAGAVDLVQPGKEQGFPELPAAEAAPSGRDALEVAPVVVRVPDRDPGQPPGAAGLRVEVAGLERSHESRDLVTGATEAIDDLGDGTPGAPACVSGVEFIDQFCVQFRVVAGHDRAQPA